MIDASWYKKPLKEDWQGRIDDPEKKLYVHQAAEHLDLLNPTPIQHGGIGIIGFCCDTGIKRNNGRVGAFFGPNEIKKAFGKLPLHSNKPIYDAGYIVAINDDLEYAQKQLGLAVAALLKSGLFPVILGGGHETAWGHYKGLTSFYQNNPINIINYDAHFDLRDVPKDGIGTSGSPFWQIALHQKNCSQDFNYHCIGIQQTGNTGALFQKAHKLNVDYLLADDIHELGKKCVENFIHKIIEKSEKIYLSICLDVFAANYAPGVSSPSILGISPHDILGSLKILAKSQKVISLDIVELSPKYDVDNQTAKLAAQLLALFL